VSVTNVPASVERRPDWATLIVAAVLVGMAIVVAIDAYNIQSGVAAYSRVGPRTFPYGIAGILGVLGVATAIMAFRGKPALRETIELSPVLWIVAGLVIQIALISRAGFSLATGAVFALTARAFGRGPLWLSYPIGVAISLAVWLAFAMALKLILPGGPLERFAQAELQAFIAFVRASLGFA
jgi:putative tricarboxylic transport membrane protein